ncbi:MAG: YIP1 family protein [Clostridia bacterium]|nr:YIP1 family protein [Clostridia bacterium]
MKKLCRIMSLAFVLIMLFATVVSAATPYATYTYSIDGLVLDSPDAYVPYGDGPITSAILGLDKPLQDPSDIESDAEENIYISDKGNNRIIVTDKHYQVKYIIESFVNYDGVEDTFKSPVSTFVVDDGDFKGLYVCDKDNKRIVVFDQETGFLKKMFNEPEIEFEDDKSGYSPVSCVVDQHGRIYVVSDKTTKGIIVLTPNGEFINFIGAPKVSVSALESLLQIVNPNAASNITHVATPYSKLDLDKTSRDFVYGTVVYTTEDDKKNQESAITSKNADYAPVRLLNASGADIMQRNGFFAPAGEVAVTATGPKTAINKNAPTGVSAVVDVASGDDGIWSIIDNKRSKVYTYDKNGNLLYIFGDSGDKFGNITKAQAITYQGDKIVVLDVTSLSFTVFRRTEYAEKLAQAIRYQNERDFDMAAEAWKEVLAWNNNFDTAYVEMGKALFRDNQPELAQQYFKNAFDTENYAEAFKQTRSNLMKTWFFPMVILIVAILIGVVYLFKWAGKVNKAAATKGGKRTFLEEFMFGFHLMFHPFDGYWDLKHEKRGSVRASIVYIVLTILAFYWQSVGQGYYYNPYNVTSTIFTQASSILIPLFLWIIANWCFTTLFDGEGSFKDIFIATSYGLFPVPALVVVSTILTNFLVGTEAQITTLIVTVAYVWMAFLIVIGMQVTHDYSMGKNILTVVATLVGMIFIMFIAVLFTSLISKMTSLVTTIISELSYR